MDSKTIYRFHKGPVLLCVLSHVDPVHAPIKDSFNIILPYIPVFSKWPFLLRLSHQNPACNSQLQNTYHMLIYLLLLYLIVQITFGE